MPRLAEHPRLGRTNFHTRRLQALGDAVIAKRTFVGRLFFGMEIAGSVGTGLNAIAAAHTVAFIYQDDPVPAQEGRPNRTHLNAGSLPTMIAQFGHKERPQNVLVLGQGREPVNTAVGAVHFHLSVRTNNIAFNPGPEEMRLPRNVVFGLAGFGACSEHP